MGRAEEPAVSAEGEAGAEGSEAGGRATSRDGPAEASCPEVATPAGDGAATGSWANRHSNTRGY
ncbi:MAG TPA: hypothetical protein PLM67_15320, partial [Thermoanaerobaculales bacterium]|nr:hypothetical protein [Thermoanaerobaculales bacterium]